MDVRKFLKHLETSEWYDGQMIRIEELARAFGAAPVITPVANDSTASADIAN